MWKESIFLPPGVCHVARVMEAVVTVIGSVRGRFLDLVQSKEVLGCETVGRELPCFISFAADFGKWL